MKKFWIVFGVVALLVGGGLGLLWYGLSRLEADLDVPGGVLVWEVGGDFAEERDTSLWAQVAGGGGMTLSEAVFGLKRAAADENVAGLVMDLRGVDADWAKIEELRGAVADFAASGKPTVAYLDGGSTREYALAVAARRIVMSPEANLWVLGVSAELAFLKETLDKLGMRADFIHVGRYKSAPERMTRSEPSEPNREMIGAIVDDRWHALLDMIAAGRGADRARAEAWIDRGLYDAPGALAAGLVDTLGYLDELIDEGFAAEDVSDFGDYVLDRRGGGGGRHRVALVYVTGVIMPGESRFDRLQGKVAGSETVVEHLEAAAADDDVDAVLLRVDSPGGSALAADLIWHALRRVQRDKPVIVSMGGMAASGGYYVAAPGDSIFAPDATLTGSIGVYAGKMDRSGMYRKIGVNREFVTRGENALLFSDAAGFTDEQRAVFTAQIEAFYERFLDKVGAGRDLERDAVHAVAQGRVWTGRQARERGLVDARGGLKRSLDAVKWRLGLTPDDKVGLVTYGERLSLVERLLLQSLRRQGVLSEALSGAAALTGLAAPPAAGTSPLPQLVATLRENGTFARLALMDGRPVAMAPYSLRVR